MTNAVRLLLLVVSLLHRGIVAPDSGSCLVSVHLTWEVEVQALWQGSERVQQAASTLCAPVSDSGPGALAKRANVEHLSTNCRTDATDGMFLRDTACRHSGRRSHPNRHDVRLQSSGPLLLQLKRNSCTIKC